MAFLGYPYFAVPPELYDQDEDSAATPPAADAPVATPPPGVVPEQVGEGRADCPPSGPPAPSPSSAVPNRCKRCEAEHTRYGDLCASCVAENRAVNGLHGAYWDLRLLLGYVDRLNGTAEGRVYLALIENTIHKALVYARCRLAVA